MKPKTKTFAQLQRTLGGLIARGQLSVSDAHNYLSQGEGMYSPDVYAFKSHRELEADIKLTASLTYEKN